MTDFEWFELVNYMAQQALESKKKYTKDWFNEQKTKCAEQAWKFEAPEFYILYDSYKLRFEGKVYEMTEKTKKMVDKELKHKIKWETRNDRLEKFRETIKISGATALSAVVLAVIVCIILGLIRLIKIEKNEEQLKKLVQKYEEKFPNWNDTIRLAKTDEELARAINKREQTRLQIENYKDSLNSISR